MKKLFFIVASFVVGLVLLAAVATFVWVAAPKAQREVATEHLSPGIIPFGEALAEAENAVTIAQARRDEIQIRLDAANAAYTESQGSDARIQATWAISNTKNELTNAERALTQARASQAHVRAQAEAAHPSEARNMASADGANQLTPEGIHFGEALAEAENAVTAAQARRDTVQVLMDDANAAFTNAHTGAERIVAMGALTNARNDLTNAENELTHARASLANWRAQAEAARHAQARNAGILRMLVLLALPCLLVALLGLGFALRRRKRQREGNADEAALFGNLLTGLDRMEGRMNNLETILDVDKTGGRMGQPHIAK